MIVLINIVTVLMMSAKMANLSPLKIKYFEIKVMTFLSITSTVKFYHVTQIKLKLWSCLVNV